MFQVTVIELVPAPAVMVPPGETLQVYPVIPVSVVYTDPVVPSQTFCGPETVGCAEVLTTTFMTVGEKAAQPDAFP